VPVQYDTQLPDAASQDWQRLIGQPPLLTPAAVKVLQLQVDSESYQVRLL
jgi:hypothetical protein